MKNKNSTTLENLREDLKRAANSEKARGAQRYFKTGKGEYGADDIFLGVAAPQTRAIVKKYWREISVADIKNLLRGKIHEERMTALLILVKKFEKGNEIQRKEIFDLYLTNTKHINNWDLVDLSSPKIVGAYLGDKDKSILLKLAKSKSLWERRIAILATFWFIGKGKFKYTLKIAAVLINDKEDLIHKAAGWGLREIGKCCGQEIEEEFLRRHYQAMPRTMLRYAIERFDEAKRRAYLTGEI